MDRRITNRTLDVMAGVISTAYTNGATLKELGVTYECAPNTVRNLLKREGIDLRSRGRKSNGKPVAEETFNVNTI